MFDPLRPWRNFGWRPNFALWRIPAYWVLGGTAVLLLMATAVGHTEINPRMIKKFFDISTLIELLMGILINTGEEAGWRGYLYPRLRMMTSWWRTIAITAVVWWAWHIPFMVVLQLRQFGEIQWTTQIVQFLTIIPTTVLLSIWFDQTRSVWAIGFAHQLGNFTNKWFLGLEHSAKVPLFFASKEYSRIYSMENGWLGLLVLIGAAVIVYRRYSRRT